MSSKRWSTSTVSPTVTRTESATASAAVSRTVSVLRWKDRSRVYDFVWCLEEYVHKPTHKRVFPDEPVPDTAKHKRPPEQPDNWFWGDIRSTWLRNLAKEGR